MNREKRFLWFSSDTDDVMNTTTEEQTTINVTTSAPSSYMVPDESGAIAGVVFGILISLGLVVVAVYLYRQKRQRDIEYQRTVKVQSRSMQNAGVYMDTTTDTLVHNVRSHNNDEATKSLTTHKDLYDDDSEDEI